MLRYIRTQLRESAEVKVRTAEQEAEIIEKIARIIIASLKKGGKLLICGNGGSAADAQHLAAELVSRFKKERKALPALALTTDTSIITAIGNDYEFAKVFERQVEALGKRGDVLLVISTSGKSENILRAVRQAKKQNMVTIAFTGNRGQKLQGLADITLMIPSEDTQRIQETHITAGHILCDLVEQRFF